MLAKYSKFPRAQDSGRECPDPGGLSQPVAGVIGGALSGVSIMVANILKLFRVSYTQGQMVSNIDII